MSSQNGLAMDLPRCRNLGVSFVVCAIDEKPLKRAQGTTDGRAKFIPGRVESGKNLDIDFSYYHHHYYSFH